MLGFLESETVLPCRELQTPYGVVRIMPPELALVERVLVACCPYSAEATVTAKKMMVAALADAAFDWKEAERLAALPSFDVLNEMLTIKWEVANGK